MKTNKSLTKHYSLATVAIASLLLLSACTSEQNQRVTLGDLDFNQQRQQQARDKVQAKSAEEIKAAYYQYLNNAKAGDTSRQMAITRLAQMELELTNQLVKDSDTQELEEDALYSATLNKTIGLLTTSLKDFPDAKGNDALLYQLARTYDQVGEYDKAINALATLTKKYQSSPYYAEAQFRIGEAAFVRGDYLLAEDAYTETIISADADRFYEKAFFKRGWTRYKQELYIESVDDYIESLGLHHFSDADNLKKNEKDLFDEYFRAIGLAFSHLNGAESLRDYFKSDSNFRYLYHIYATIADIYKKQERYSDAVNTLNQFVEYHPHKAEVPKAQLSAIAVWQSAGFASRVHQAVENFYEHYNPNASYWVDNSQNKYRQESKEALKQYIADEASYFHALYQDKKQKKQRAKNYADADKWYQRYLKHFADFGRKDGIYRQYGELLYSAKDYRKALPLFEVAAYDGSIILDKRSAYLTINLADRLYRQNSSSEDKTVLLNKLIDYSGRYIALYPNDKRSTELGINAAQLAFNNQRYEQALQIAHGIADANNTQKQYTIDLLKARAYFELKDYADAEAAYLSMLGKTPTSSQRRVLSDNLALAIYRQAELAKADNNPSLALHHFTRIHKVAPTSDIAASALYDGIALAMEQKEWPQAIALINRFQQLYPKHKYQNDVTKKLSVAYLQSDQGDKAAQQFERISSFEKDDSVKMAALWKAAELYENKNDVDGAIRSYRNFAHQYKQVFAQNMEAMYKLTQLYAKKHQPQKRFFWQKKIATAGRRANDKQKTERTIFIAASTTLDLAEQQYRAYQKRKLVAPLKDNLRKKKALMQESIRLYGNASSYGLADVTTQSTYAIGNMYQDFSQALLNSERPTSLSADELEQYEILLEDQAFPFEDKAIEFYETNLARSQDGLFNDWLAKSREHLAELFPVRYSRQPKISGYLTDQGS